MGIPQGKEMGGTSGSQGSDGENDQHDDNLNHPKAPGPKALSPNRVKTLIDVGWYASAYLSTTCTLFVFELGSLICGVAPTSTALIIGRAIAGLGSAGIFTGSLATIAHIVDREEHPFAGCHH
ncbi:hypothetical protein EDB80DRAFT_684790 [Ilyonectria destructans]|nr:hypothetical protein EDB80DRAFT_684790 [Ilyonectria destructans]